MLLDDKVCVITGSGNGIGRATAVEMAQRGASVVVSDIDDSAGEETVQLVEETGGRATYIRCDVRAASEVEALMDGAADCFGGIDILHNNAGVHDSYFAQELTVDTLPLDAWESVYEVNLRGVWLCTRFAAAHLKRSQRGPAIINASSTGGHVGFPMSAAYSATKGAVIQLTKVMAIDLAPVRCNCYSPAGTDTNMVRRYTEAADDKEAVLQEQIATHLIRRLGEPDDIARLVCFLASDEAAWITGADFVIDGGSLAWRGQHL